MERVVQTRKRPRRDWAAIIEAQSKSGQTAGIYCREQDIPYKSFLYHRRKTERRKAALQATMLHDTSASSFIPLRVSSVPRVLLRIPASVVLEFDRPPDVSWLIELTRGLSCGGPASC